VLALLFLLLQDLQTEYEEKRLQAPQTARGQFELGKWCDARKLREQAIKAYERAVEIDPDFEPAHKALGRKKVLGRWASERDYADPKWWTHPKVDQKKVDDAIIKGVEWLLSQKDLTGGKHNDKVNFRYDELVLLTVLESGWDRKDSRVTALVERVLRQPLDMTYHVSVRAMCLAAIDPMKYQQQLAECAQWLVDNQAENGQWGYGKKVNLPATFPTTGKGPIPDIETGLEVREPGRRKPKQIEISKRESTGDKAGDNSNSQYAALGIRACLSGLVVVPKETVKKAHDFWEKCQDANGGWGYNAVHHAISGQWGSMTAGAIGCLAIYKYYLARVWNENADWRKSTSIDKGIKWLAARLDFTKNPLYPYGNWWHHYWLYAIERAGRLLETETFVDKEWYPGGANWLLARQNADGSWQKEDWGRGSKEHFLPGLVSETCFAILFLRRATPRLDDTIKTGK
jgi:hypothetical protein